MIKFFLIILSVILTSFYFFPFEFVFLPEINTKMAMAGVGLVICGVNLAKHPFPIINTDFFYLSLIGMFISLISWFSMTYNGTNDGSFLTYIVSMWVWLGGAYCLINWLRMIHGYLSITLVCNYLIMVCVAQCIIAYAMNVYAPLKDFVDSFLGGEDAFMGKAETRIYGIGAALDVSGMRFSAVLAMIAFLSVKMGDTSKFYYVKWYICAFFIIAVIGNMMSRTTTIGVGLALVYWLYFCRNVSYPLRDKHLYLKWLIGALLIGIPVVISLYYTNQAFYTNLRFGFEGFFALWENGKWEVQSNNIWFEHMWTFPDTWKTWLIGDGYGANPDGDPYYTGPNYHGFYKGTDVGYLRFLFYFGIIGTFLLILYICRTALACIRKFPKEKEMFLLILIVNLVCWFKASTDIFLAFAPFLCMSREEDEAYVMLQKN